MVLTPLEIHNKEFKTKLRGYDQDEVNEFLDQVVTAYMKILNEKQALEAVVVQKDEKIKALMEKLTASES